MIPHHHRSPHVQAHEVATGLWCPTCLLPSVVRWALLDCDTLAVIARAETCEECGAKVRLT